MYTTYSNKVNSTSSMFFNLVSQETRSSGFPGTQVSTVSSMLHEVAQRLLCKTYSLGEKVFTSMVRLYAIRKNVTEHKILGA